MFLDSTEELIEHSPVPSWCAYDLKMRAWVALKPVGEVRSVLAKQQSRWGEESLKEMADIVRKPSRQGDMS